jgi:Protein of unknown function (DUF2934)
MKSQSNGLAAPFGEPHMNSVPARAVEVSMQAITFLDTKLPEPTVEHEIRLFAYEICESRGKMEGHALEDWLQAQADAQRRSRGF